MKVAGFGLRAAATLASLRAAMGDVAGLTALAAPEDKAGHPALRALASAENLPLIAVPLADLRGQACKTLSPRQPLRYGAGSVAEASALAACGPGARLITQRQTAPDGMATAAIAAAIAAPIAEGTAP